MSCESVRQWKEFCETLVRQETRQDWPHITCVEDLLLAAKAVRRSFQHSVSLLKTEGGNPINAFDLRKYGQPVWYRGEPHRDPKWSLCPTVFRDDFYLNRVAGFRSAEKWTITEFWRKAVLRSPHCPDPGRRLAWLALAQHHGLPTRLLDWSESIMSAAWFATHDEPEALFRCQLAEARNDVVSLLAAVEKIDPSLKERVLACVDAEAASRIRSCIALAPTESVIWALSPALLNWHFTEPANGAFVFLRESDRILADAFSGEQAKEDCIWAIWVQDAHPRMMCQGAYFTIHATDTSLATINNELPDNERFVRKLIVEPRARSHINEDLAAAGVTASTIFPDLDHLAREIAERWRKIVSAVASNQAAPPT